MSALIEPIPSCASKVDLSKGDDANSVEEGDIKPKLSAGSTSGDGCRGVIANSSERAEARSVGVVESDSSLRSGDGAWGEDIGDTGGSTTFKTGIAGTTRPDGFTYADPGFTALIARARCPGGGGGPFCSGQLKPEGADDGPGLNTGRESAVCAAESGPTPADNGAFGDGLFWENGPPHSLIAELGVIGDSPRSAASRPPRWRLVRNSWSCMIRFILGPIHLLRAFTAS